MDARGGGPSSPDFPGPLFKLFYPLAVLPHPSAVPRHPSFASRSPFSPTRPPLSHTPPPLAAFHIPTVAFIIPTMSQTFDPWGGEIVAPQSLPPSAQVASPKPAPRFDLPTSLSDINLEERLVSQLNSLQGLQDEILGDTETPANQKAQVANSLSNALANLTKLQQTIYTSERLKKIEAILLRAIKTLPSAQIDTFMDDYEEMLSDGLD